MSSILEWLTGQKAGTFNAGQWRFGFATEHNNYIKLALIGVLVFMIWLTIHCYRREGNISKRIKGFLAAIRIAVISLIVLALFQPAIIVRITETLHSTVLFVFDDSMSMSYKDNYADPKQADHRKEMSEKLGVTEAELTQLSRLAILKKSMSKANGAFEKISANHPVEFLRFSTDNSKEISYTRQLGPTMSVDAISKFTGAEEGVKDLAEKAKVLGSIKTHLDALAEKNFFRVEEVAEITADMPIWLEFIPSDAKAYETKLANLVEKMKKLKPEAPAPAAETKPGEAKKPTPTELLRNECVKLLGEVRNPPIAAGDIRSMMGWMSSKGFTTDYATAIRDAIDRNQGRKIGAIVVVGDGMDTQAGSTERLEAALQYAGDINRYAIMVGDPTPPKNIQVAALRAPREIRSGMDTTAQVVVNHRNLAGQKVDVKLYRRKVADAWPEDIHKAELVASERVKLEGDIDAKGQSRASQKVNLDFKPSSLELGEFVYRAVVEKRKDELTDEDNWVETFINVSDKKIRVLLVSSDGGWEYQYIRNYFLRQRELYRLSVWQQNADKKVSQMASSGMKLTRLPRTLRELIDTGEKDDKVENKESNEVVGKFDKEDKIPPGYDVVILYDPHGTKGGFDDTFLKLLKEYVTVHGGGLCYIASAKNSLDVLNEDDASTKPLRDIMPVTVTKGDVNVETIIKEKRPAAHQAKLTGYGLDHPITKLEGSTTENTKLWRDLPGVYWSQSVKTVKMGARILALNSNPMRKTTLKSEPEPLIVVQTAGSGRVLYMGFDETWRWRYIEDGYYHQRFWGNVVRYLAALNNHQVTITAGGDRFDAGSKVTVEVEAFDSNYKPLKLDKFEVEEIDTKTGKLHRKFNLLPVKGKPGRYTGQIIADRTGTFELTCSDKIAPKDKIGSKQIVVEMPQAEAQRTEANFDVLRSIVTKPEYLLTVENIDQLADLIPDDRRNRFEDRSYQMWDTEAMMYIIVVLLAVEWFIRKRVNMA